MESISSVEIGTRHWMGEQGAPAATARKRLPRVYLCTGCPHAKTQREYWTAGLGPIEENRFKSWLLEILSYRSIYIMN